ncbi:MAG: methyltetrahydrofolate cobalamin methyltransferase [Deltaproteobacteria bacterium]|jgi:5-methyltetrahydrofolate--homocysteine methyltransferase|nr:methyltetrahydrofolate cobalamin methyltransferase [Deltaproteobacteria bacterium]
MIIVGELINASRKAVGEAIEKGDAEYIKSVAMDEDKAGANYIDVNAGIFVGKEADYLKWLTTTVQEVSEKPCALDSPDPLAIEAALAVHKGTPMINSISLEKDRWEKLLPLVAGTDFKVVALCMSDEGMPTTCADRLVIADKLVEGLTAKGVAIENIYVDPLVQPLGTNHTFGLEFINTVAAIKERYPNIHFMCGLSNISYGLPERKFINRIFMAQAIYAGLDGAIMNPLDQPMMGAIAAAEALAGRDRMCVKYLKAFRAGLVKA